MLRILLVLIPFAFGALAGAFAVSRGAHRRFWAMFVVSALIGTMPALRIVDRVIGTRHGETVRVWLSNTAGCADIGCGFAGNLAYALSLIGLMFAAGLVAGGLFARGKNSPRGV